MRHLGGGACAARSWRSRWSPAPRGTVPRLRPAATLPRRRPSSRRARPAPAHSPAGRSPRTPFPRRAGWLAAWRSPNPRNGEPCDSVNMRGRHHVHRQSAGLGTVAGGRAAQRPDIIQARDAHQVDQHEEVMGAPVASWPMRNEAAPTAVSIIVHRPAPPGNRDPPRGWRGAAGRTLGPAGAGPPRPGCSPHDHQQPHEPAETVRSRGRPWGPRPALAARPLPSTS